MLKVEDVFRSLSLGHLSNLAMATENDNEGEIRQKDRNKLITYMNQALTKLYSRFCLSEKSLIINQYPTITNYHLDRRFSTANEDRPVDNDPYILDLPAEPYLDDAINILKVQDENGCELPLNQNDKVNSLFTPYPTILNVPNPVEDKPLIVTYQAAHPKLEMGVLTAEVILPLVLEEALLCYVSYLVYNGMNTEGAKATAQGHLSCYEDICVRTELKSHADISKNNHGSLFEERGFR